MTVGADVQELVERPHLIDGDLLTGFLLAPPRRRRSRSASPRLRRATSAAAGADPGGCLAPASRKPGTDRKRCPTRSRALAEQRGGKAARQLELADPALTGNQERVRQLSARRS
jgi:hypothetical protein